MVTGAVQPADGGELLTLQRAAFVTEAQLYDDPRLPALVETLPELLAAVQRGLAARATCGCTRGRATSSSAGSGWTTS